MEWTNESTNERMNNDEGHSTKPIHAYSIIIPVSRQPLTITIAG